MLMEELYVNHKTDNSQDGMEEEIDYSGVFEDAKF